MKLAQLQKDAVAWGVECFGWEIVKDKRERGRRFIEEAIELVQAAELPKEDVLKLVERVYSRPKGTTREEIGGVLVTAAVLSEAMGENMSSAATAVIQYCRDNIDKIRKNGIRKREMDI